MTEIERLKATGQLSAEGPGPQGSLTISDIRLPLKRDFVTKIGTSHGLWGLFLFLFFLIRFESGNILVHYAICIYSV